MLGSKLISNSAIFLSSQLIVALVGFITIPILTTFLTPEEYGIIGMYMILISFLECTVGLSISSSVYVNFFQLPKEKFCQYLSNSLILLIINSAAFLIIVIIFNSILSKALGLSLYWLIFALILALFKNFSNVTTQLWIANSRAKTYATFEVLQAILIALISILLIVHFNYQWEGRLYSINIIIIIFGIISYIYLNNVYKIHYSYHKKTDWKEALSFGLPLIPHTLGGFIIQSTDRLLLNELINLSNVGIYLLALQFGLSMSMITSTIPKIFSPWLMKNLASSSLNKLKVVLMTYVAMLILIIIAIIIGYIITYALPFIVKNDQYLAVNQIIIYICLAYAFNGCYYLVTSYIFYTKKTQSLAIITLSNAIINIPLTYFFILHNGLVGAAQAFMLTHLSYFLMTWIISQKMYPMPWTLQKK